MVIFEITNVVLPSVACGVDKNLFPPSTGANEGFFFQREERAERGRATAAARCHATTEEGPKRVSMLEEVEEVEGGLSRELGLKGV